MLKMKNTQHFGHIVFYYFKKGKNTTETQKYRLVEKVLWLMEHVKSGLRFVLEISSWTMLHGQVPQMTLIVIRSRH